MGAGGGWAVQQGTEGKMKQRSQKSLCLDTDLLDSLAAFPKHCTTFSVFSAGHGGPIYLSHTVPGKLFDA